MVAFFVAQAAARCSGVLSDVPPYMKVPKMVLTPACFRYCAVWCFGVSLGSSLLQQADRLCYVAVVQVKFDSENCSRKSTLSIDSLASTPAL